MSLEIIKQRIAKLEEIRGSLNKSIKEAEQVHKNENFIKLLHNDYERIVFALNVLYSIEKELEVISFKDVIDRISNTLAECPHEYVAETHNKIVSGSKSKIKYVGDGFYEEVIENERASRN